MNNQNIAYKIGRKIVKIVKNIAFTTGSLKQGAKQTYEYIKKEPYCFTYPLLGNLSGSLQERIENSTKGGYNAENAFVPSIFASGLTKILLGAYLLHYGENIQGYELGLINWIGAASASIGIFEPFFRLTEKSQFPCSSRSVGSLEGKLVSMPIEIGIGIYEGIKQGGD